MVDRADTDCAKRLRINETLIAYTAKYMLDSFD
jgi:hypothetical protein